MGLPIAIKSFLLRLILPPRDTNCCPENFFFSCIFLANEEGAFTLTILSVLDIHWRWYKLLTSYAGVLSSQINQKEEGIAAGKRDQSFLTKLTLRCHFSGKRKHATYSPIFTFKIRARRTRKGKGMKNKRKDIAGQSHSSSVSLSQKRRVAFE